MDTGDILLRLGTPIGPTETTRSLPRVWRYQRSFNGRALRGLRDRTMQPTPQNPPKLPWHRC
jgi:methionyl-tRNA formyltransferase